MKERIGIIGSGSWGTALAISMANTGKTVALWARREQLVQELRETRKNEVYLKEAVLPESIRIDSDLGAIVSNSEILVFAVPSQSARSVSEDARPFINAGHIVVSVAKGVENDSLKLASEVLEDTLSAVPREQVGVLYGPSHAEEVARGIPSAVVASSYSRETALIIQQAFLLRV